jgi:hypothetical protein
MSSTEALRELFRVRLEEHSSDEEALCFEAAWPGRGEDGGDGYLGKPGNM